MQWIDVVILSIIGVSALISLVRGFVKEAMSLAGGWSPFGLPLFILMYWLIYWLILFPHRQFGLWSPLPHCLLLRCFYPH